jgi:four helix bundle protein
VSGQKQKTKNSSGGNMAKAEKFEDLIVWQEARLLRKEVYAASKSGPFARDFEMRSQIRSAALSAMDNIAEGFERGTNKEFAKFLNIAKGSAGEVRSALYGALDEDYLTKSQFEQLRSRALSVSRRSSRFITYLQTANRKRTSTHLPVLRPDDWAI